MLLAAHSGGFGQELISPLSPVHLAESARPKDTLSRTPLFSYPLRAARTHPLQARTQPFHTPYTASTPPPRPDHPLRISTCIWRSTYYELRLYLSRFGSIFPIQGKEKKLEPSTKSKIHK